MDKVKLKDLEDNFKCFKDEFQSLKDSYNEELIFYKNSWRFEADRNRKLKNDYDELLKEVEHLRHLCKLFNIKDLNKQ